MKTGSSCQTGSQDRAATRPLAVRLARAARVRAATLPAAAWQPRAPTPASPRTPPASGPPYLPAGEERRPRLQHPRAAALAQHRLPVPALGGHQLVRWRLGLHRGRRHSLGAATAQARRRLGPASSNCAGAALARGGEPTATPPDAGAASPVPRWTVLRARSRARAPAAPEWLGAAAALRRDHCRARDPHLCLR